MTLLQAIETLLILAVLGLVAAGTMWFERRMLGWMQERQGPNRTGPFGLLQPAADVIKLVFKEDRAPPFVDRGLFVVAPVIVAFTALLAFAIVPITPTLGVVDLDVGLLFFLAMGSLAVYSAMVGGWASRSKYSLLGALRAAAQTISYEVFMGISALGVVVLAGTLDLRAIVEAQRSVPYIVYQPVGAAVFLIAAVAETHRLPFDLPEAEAELSAGYHTEYAGMKFGLFFVGEYVEMVVASALVTTLFLGGWLGPVLPPFVWFALKVFALLVFFVVLRGALPRPRVDQLMGWGWKVLLPLSLLNLVITGAVVLALEGP